jgi:hypothetical protein
LLGKLAQSLRQGLSVRIKVDENQIGPFLGPHRRQGEFPGIEAGCPSNSGALTALRPARKSSRDSRSETPCAIRILRPEARRGGGRRYKSAQLTLGAAHQQQRLAQQLRGKEVARLQQLLVMPHHLPGTSKDAISFPRAHLRVGVEKGRNRPRREMSASI